MEFTGRGRGGRGADVTAGLHVAGPGGEAGGRAADGAGGGAVGGVVDAEAADFHRVFTEILPRLRRAAVSLGGSSFAADDLVHDAYLRIARRPERFLGHPHPYAYAFTTMTNIVRDQWRRERRRTVVSEPVEGERARADPSGGGLGELQSRWEVLRLLRRLTPKQARVVALVDLDGYTVDEAAALLGLHRSTLAVTRRRALVRLRAIVEGEREREGGRERGGECEREDEGEREGEGERECEHGRGRARGRRPSGPGARPDAPN
ncbi:RNA polymerase sigma factor [Kitasatospora sp. NPDC127111]|uniref:RNA polymerase sigma factor n=1 Tax=Kitasatospora sp. NPDC127111 TaxID=3345363 RepID=UPI0036373A33